MMMWVGEGDLRTVKRSEHGRSGVQPSCAQPPKYLPPVRSGQLISVAAMYGHTPREQWHRGNGPTPRTGASRLRLWAWRKPTSRLRLRGFQGSPGVCRAADREQQHTGKYSSECSVADREHGYLYL